MRGPLKNALGHEKLRLRRELSAACAGSHVARHRIMQRATYILIMILGGCVSDHDPQCLQASAGIADSLYRDPSTGQCESIGGSCDSSCGSCPELAAIAPDWGACSGTCDSLPEAQCLVTANCHTAYQDDSAASPVFWGCWDMPPTGVLHGSCVNLDAQMCSEHDDCSSLYTGPVNQPPSFVPSFESCQPETI
jgi:hypothetical protein